MAHTKFFIWVEGLDDIRFFERILLPVFEEKYNQVIIKGYKKLSKRTLRSYIQEIKSNKFFDYIFVVDINHADRVSLKKQEEKRCKGYLDENRIIVVIKEIESWYLAGLGDKGSKKLGISRNLIRTEHITKEQFNNIMPKAFFSRISFMFEILNLFSTKTAKKKNCSFRYFAKKYSIT